MSRPAPIRYISHDQRWGALCEYLDAGNVEILLSRATRGPEIVSAKSAQAERQLAPAAEKEREETVEERIERRTR